MITQYTENSSYHVFFWYKLLFEIKRYPQISMHFWAVWTVLTMWIFVITSCNIVTVTLGGSINPVHHFMWYALVDKFLCCLSLTEICLICHVLSDSSAVPLSFKREWSLKGSTNRQLHMKLSQKHLIPAWIIYRSSDWGLTNAWL